ncbi:MAG: HAMP domain-containing histidine kinase [bacterium]|nr:HAMP domain-containing histidine kinase [bacterium]
MIMQLKYIFGLLIDEFDAVERKAFHEELERQCGLFFFPTMLMALFTWLPFIEADKNLYPQYPIIVYLRIGLTVVSGSMLLLHTLSFFRKIYYPLLVSLLIYLEVSTAVILGLVAADPVYMGGYNILIMALPLLPFRREHLITLLLAPIVLFSGIGIYSQMNFNTWHEKYGLYNVVSSVLLSLIGILIFDNVRKKRFKKKRLLEVAHKELQAYSDELARTNEELNKANEVKSDLLGLAAHDLKNPLQVILGYTSILQDNMKDDPESIQRLRMINKSSDKMLKLIAELLESATIDSGQLQLNITAIDVSELVKSVVASLTHLADKKKQPICLDCKKGCIIYGDKMLMQEVVDNLVSNAIKFSPYEKKIWVSVKNESGTITFKVRDEGPGLTSEDKDKIFGKFQRLSARPTGGETSTGLGLSIIKQLVELHDGNVYVDSEPDKGSTFSVVVPAAAAEGV